MHSMIKVWPSVESKDGFVPSEGVLQRLEGERPMAQGEMNLARRKCRGHVATDREHDMVRV